MLKRPITLAALTATISLIACGGGESESPSADGSGEAVTEVNTKAEHCAPTADGSRSVMVTGHSVFKNDAQGNPLPQPAQMRVWCADETGNWKSDIVDDPDSNVFHKIIPMEDGRLITIGAMAAHLKEWKVTDGNWSGTTLWQKSWGGRFDRLRDIEIGDVDQDGKDEWAIATHDQGVVAVYNPDEGAETVIEMDQKADIFVHEIEIGDVDGDGKLEFFATPSDRNQVGHSQKGSIVMYQFDGTQYVRSIVEAKEGTHAKEILATDLDGDGTSELLGVFEAELNESGGIETPVQIRSYTLQPDGSFEASVLAEIQDEMCRFLIAGDIDGDGQVEMVASAKTSGVWLLERGEDGTWTPENIDRNSSGFEHVSKMMDMDGDGTPELYVAADKQRTLSQYSWNPETKSFDKKILGSLPSGFTWNLEGGKI